MEANWKNMPHSILALLILAVLLLVVTLPVQADDGSTTPGDTGGQPAGAISNYSWGDGNVDWNSAINSDGTFNDNLIDLGVVEFNADFMYTYDTYTQTNTPVNDGKAVFHVYATEDGSVVLLPDANSKTDQYLGKNIKDSGFGDASFLGDNTNIMEGLNEGGHNQSELHDYNQPGDSFLVEDGQDMVYQDEFFNTLLSGDCGSGSGCYGLADVFPIGGGGYGGYYDDTVTEVINFYEGILGAINADTGNGYDVSYNMAILLNSSLNNCGLNSGLNNGGALPAWLLNGISDVIQNIPGIDPSDPRWANLLPNLPPGLVPTIMPTNAPTAQPIPRCSLPVLFRLLKHFSSGVLNEAT